MLETYHVTLEGKEGQMPGKVQAVFLRECFKDIDYPADVVPAKEGLKVTIHDPECDGMEELTEKLIEAGVVAYVEES